MSSTVPVIIDFFIFCSFLSQMAFSCLAVIFFTLFHMLLATYLPLLITSSCLIFLFSFQVICSKCNNVSIQFEHMMDLTVEINGDAESLEECLDQFTAEEWLHGDNMYKCDW